MRKGFDRRVVVTGLGVITSLGIEHAKVFERLCKGENGIKTIRRFNTEAIRSKIGGIIEDFDPSLIISDRNGLRALRLTDWVQTLAMCSIEKAWLDSGLAPGKYDPERTGIFMGAGRGGYDALTTMLGADLKQLDAYFRDLMNDGSGNERAAVRLDKLLARASTLINPLMFLQQCPCLVSAYSAIRYDARGPSLTNVNLCSASSQSIGEAAWVISRGDADVMVAGGADSMLNPIELTAFCNLDAVSGKNDPETASRPFDYKRDGCVVGEGAAAMILEERSHALARGVSIYAELLGYGSSSDAYKIQAPPPNGRGAVSAMRAALAHARLRPEDIDHVNAHGTSTPLNDKTETSALKEVLGPRAYEIPVVSTKSSTGHLIAAAGALEAVIAVKALEEQRVPPTRNFEHRDPRCDLDYVPEGQRSMPGLRTVLSNSFAIGGTNSCLIFGHPAAET